MRVAILGAGGVGGYYGAALARIGLDVTLFARGAHLDAIRSRGLEIRTPEGTIVQPVAATDDPAALGAADVVLIAVKAYSLAEVAPVAAALADAGADVVPLLNGVDAVDRLVAQGVPRPRILGGLTYISAARIAPGVVERWSPFQRVVVGEPGGGASPRAERIAAAFAAAGVEARASDRIDVDLWTKLIFLASVVAACGLARSPLGPVREAPYGPLLLERSVREIAAVGRARGVPLPADEEERALAQLRAIPPTMRPSLLLDLEAGGPTELDILSGAIARMGREAGIETPVHDAVVAALTAAQVSRGQGAAGAMPAPTAPQATVAAGGVGINGTGGSGLSGGGQ